MSAEFQELTLEGFDAESSNKTSMKNTGKTGKDSTSLFPLDGGLLYDNPFSVIILTQKFNDELKGQLKVLKEKL